MEELYDLHGIPEEHKHLYHELSEKGKSSSMESLAAFAIEQ